MADITYAEINEIMEQEDPGIEDFTKVARFLDKHLTDPEADNLVLGALLGDLARLSTQIELRTIGPREAAGHMLQINFTLKVALEKLPSHPSTN